MGHELPEHPTLFAKYRAALIGAHDDIVLPPASSRVDWEAELAVVIGARSATHRPARRTPRSPATRYSTTCPSATSRRRTSQFLQGKTFEASTPLGPWLVTADELPDLDRAISCEVERCRDAGGDDRRSRLRPCRHRAVRLGDHHARARRRDRDRHTGWCRRTPAHRRCSCRPGDEVVTRIDGIGELRNTCRPE